MRADFHFRFFTHFMFPLLCASSPAQAFSRGFASFEATVHRASSLARTDSTCSDPSNSTADDIPHESNFASEHGAAELADARHESLRLSERLRRSEARLQQWKQAVERLEKDYQTSQDRIKDLESVCAEQEAAAASSLADRHRLEQEILQCDAINT
jgi:hypothetical protein